LKIYLSNGTSTVLVDQQVSDPTIFFQWQDKVLKVQDFIVPTANMTLTVKVSDLDPNINVTEAGFDFFYVENESHLGFNETVNASTIILYPNPVVDIITLVNTNENEAWKLIDLNARDLYHGKTNKQQTKIDISNLSSGIYLIQIRDKSYKFVKE